MRCLLYLLCAGFAGLAGLRPAQAAPAVPARADLLAESTTLQAGATSWLGIRLVPDAGWHTYWRNPGDSGLATSVHWTLPPGVTAGDIVWPAPERIEVGGIANYGFAGEVLLLVPLQLPAQARAGSTLRLAGEVSFLVCREVCIPGSAAIALSRTVSAQPGTADAGSAAAFAQARARLPVPLPAPGDARFDVRGTHLLLRVTTPADGLRQALFFPDDNTLIDHSAPVQVASDGNAVQLAMPLGTLFKAAPARLDGVLEGRRADGSAVAWSVSATRAPLAETAPPAHAALGLARALLLAFAGGLLLNLMPCVFPVLSIKALALAGDGSRRAQAISYAAGVLASMTVLAGVLLALRAAGEELGWGFQLQSPAFVGGLAYLLFAMGLSLSGVVEFGAQLMGAGQSLVQGRGHAGSFFTGVLAVVVATPCTAPFMAPAMGYALAQPAEVALVVLLALGAGLAAPVLALAAVPAARRWLPRPGAWMETFRQLMAFPLYASSVWLAWVVGRQAGVDALAWTLLGGVLLALGLWARGRWPRHSASAAAAAIAVVAAAGMLALLPRHGSAATVTQAQDGGAQPYSEARLAALREQHRTVFVDFTADWCITCKVNEHVALDTPAVQQSFAAHDVAWLVADWTNGDPAITQALARFGRPGVPLYLVYPAGGAPQVLPQILTPGIVTAAIDAAARPAATAAR